MKMQNNKIKTSMVILTSLIIGSIMLSPTTVMPNVVAQPQLLPHMKIYDTSYLKPGQVMTPFGLTNASNIHRYNGTVINTDKLISDYLAGVHSGKIKPTPHNQLSPPGTHWNEYAYWVKSSGGAISTFSGYWKVPSAPSSSYSGTQVAYLFNDLLNGPRSSANIIIQPVLQYGNNGYYAGGNYWQIVAWMYITTTGQYYIGTPVNVNIGDTIYGSLSDVSNTWTISAQDQSQVGNPQSSEAISSTSSFTEADVTFELDTTIPQTCAYLPGNTDFTSLTLSSGGSQVTPTWNTGHDVSLYCNENPVVVSSSEVYLHTTS